MKSDEILNSPIKMLAEIEAFLAFRLLADEPRIEKDEIQSIKADLAECLKRNGGDKIVWGTRARSLPKGVGQFKTRRRKTR